MSALTSSASASSSVHAQCKLRAVIRFHDEARSGRPSVSDNLQEQAESELREDRRVTVRELEEKLQIPKSSLHRIISDLGYRKCSTRWMPKMLTEDERLKDCVKP